MKNTKKNRKILKAMNNGHNWTGVGAYAESIADHVPDLSVESHNGDTYDDQCEFAIEVARRLNDYPNVVRKCAAQAKRIRAMKAALKQISEYPANSNSEADVMGGALDEIERIAAEAMKA